MLASTDAQVLKRMQGSFSEGRRSIFESLTTALGLWKTSFSVAELDSLIRQLSTYKREAQQAEGESNMELLLQFLQHSREDKMRKLKSLERELACLDTDIDKVENVFGGSAKNDLGAPSDANTFSSNAAEEEELFPNKTVGRGRHSTTEVPPSTATHAMQQAALLTAQQQSHARQHHRSTSNVVGLSMYGGRMVWPTNSTQRPTNFPSPSTYHALASHPGMATYLATQFQGETSAGGQTPTGRHAPADDSRPSGSLAAQEVGSERLKRRRITAQLDDLHSVYRRLRATRLKDAIGENQEDGAVAENVEGGTNGGDGVAPMASSREGAIVDPGLQEFSRMLSVLTRCNKLRQVAEIPRPSLRQTSSIISSVEFDRDGTLFATAGVSKRISVFEHASVLRANRTLVHCPVVEMVTRSKLSCLSWNRYVASHLASSDYEGVVTLWDVHSSSMVQEYEAHAKRIWSVDFCSADPTLLASGSDDSTVKLWSTRTQASLAQIDLRANVCAVKWRPGSAHDLAVGSADHTVYLYDLRNAASPVATFGGHRKAVSYVRWAGEHELVSASTDSTLRLWDTGAAPGSPAERVYEGHMNEKNFVGLSVDGEFLACGSETNEAFVYLKPLSNSVAHAAFTSSALPSTAFGNGENEDATVHMFAGGANEVEKAFVSAVCWRPGGIELLVADSHGTVRLLQLAGDED